MMKARIALASILVTLLLPFQVIAAPVTPSHQFAVCGNGASNFLFLQPWYACLQKNSDGSPKITKLEDMLLIVFPVVEALVKIAAYVAVAVIFGMIFKMLTARGDSGKIASAGLGIRDAIIGLIIALSSVAIINFINAGITR